MLSPPNASSPSTERMAAAVREWKKPVGLSGYGCFGPLGDARETARALNEGRVALRLAPVHGEQGGEAAPIALVDSAMHDAPPRWETHARTVRGRLPGGGWGSPGRPVIVTSSNFGIDQLVAYKTEQDRERLLFAQPHTSAARLAEIFGWTAEPTLISHACVSSSLGLLHACELVENGLAEEALVFSYDFVSPFVSAGFAALKILNSGFPAPFADRSWGAIGLGDAMAWAVVSSKPAPFRLRAAASRNEMFHMTANNPDASGFETVAEAMARVAAGRKLWVKGHGTGTLDAGRMESGAFSRRFPEAPLVSWKGSLGHTLGTCGLFETVIALEAIAGGKVPGTVGSEAPAFSGNVALDSFSPDGCNGFISFSNAFGGAHVAHFIDHD
ncbi:MAG: hypothetical protein ACLFS4_01280 [Opitutales bacterium]